MVLMPLFTFLDINILQSQHPPAAHYNVTGMVVSPMQ